MEFDEKRLNQLLSALVDGQLDDADGAELEKTLMESKEARAMYRDAMAIHCNLSEARIHDSAPNEDDMILVPGEIARDALNSGQARSKVVTFVMPMVLAAACWFLLMVATSLLTRTDDLDPEKTLVEVDLPTGFIATVYEVKGEVDANLSRGLLPRQGADLGATTLDLKSGTISLLFGCGANVTLAGPARFEIVDEMNAILHEGRLVADVPEIGHGFTIHTEDYAVEDLGTQFGMEVLGNGMSDVHVLSGQVALIQHGLEKLLLNTGESARYLKGQLQRVTLNDTDYQKLHQVSAVSYKLPGVASGPFGNIETGRITSEHDMEKGRNEFQSDQHGFLLEESIGSVLPETVEVDHIGRTQLLTGEEALMPGSIEAGTRVNSYLFRSDMQSNNGVLSTVSTIEFTTPILGLQSLQKTMRPTNPYVSPARGHASRSATLLNDGWDRAYIWPDGKTITLRSAISGVGSDTLRILTAAE